MLELLKYAGLITTFGVIAGGTYLLLKSRVERTTIRSALDEVVVASPLVAESRTVVMDAPFAQRVLAPGARRLAQLVYRFGPRGLQQRTNHRLVLAGLSERLDADTFYALSALLPLAMTGVLFGYRELMGPIPTLGWIVIPAAAFFPKMWLTSRVEARQNEIRRALPDTLDLLTIAVEAGLGFDSALGRVVTSVPGPLSDELYRMLQELRLGVPRAQALRNLSARTELLELDQFITAMTQADSFGISIGKVLRVQSQQLRLRRSQAAEERAAKTTVKLLFPLILCIFPGLFVVIVGPAAISIMQTLFGAI